MLNKIRELDFLSFEVSLYFDGGSKNYKSAFGGVMSLLNLFLTFSLIIYFLTLFFNQSNVKLVNNIEGTNKVNISNFSNIPFMIRLSFSGSVTINNPLSLYRIIGQLRYVPTDPNDPRSKNQTVLKSDIEMEQCDINNPVHFNTLYRELFANNTDIGTFFCANYKQEYDLYGLYGDSSPFSYMNYFIRPCRPKEDGENMCGDPKDINFLLSGANVDIRTLDYTIDNFAANSKKPISVGLRWQQTNTIFKRTRIYYRFVNYFTDAGYLFEEKKLTNFFQIFDIASDVDLRDFERNDVKGAFARINLENFKETISYHRSYMKIQELIALLGGILSSVKFLSYYLNYYISLELYNLELMNHIPDILYKTEYYCKNNKKDDIIDDNNGNIIPSNSNKTSKSLKENNLIKIKKKIS